ncbi:MAG: hypothetical protein GX217_07030 [Clostridiaceae bacterium]|nr:hypothetical protein [Clostridiaceae bacterium]
MYQFTIVSSLDEENNYNEDMLEEVYSSLLNTIPKVDIKRLTAVRDIILKQLDKAQLKNRYLEVFFDGLLERIVA